MTSKLIHIIRTAFTVPTVVIFTLFCSIVAILIIAPLRVRNIQDLWIRFWAYGVMWLSGVIVKYRGPPVPNGKLVMVSNHLSAYDIPILFVAVPISFRMAAKAELFNVFLFGRAMKALGFISVARGKLKAGKQAVDKAKQELDRGYSVWFAPEGTRFPPGQMGPFKAGAFKLAIDNQAPIFPLVIYGSDLVLPNKSLWVNSGRWRREVIVEGLSLMPPFPEPFSEKAQAQTALEKLRDEARASLVAAYENLQRSNPAPRY